METRIYHCQSCGALIPTRKTKGYITCSCGTRGKVSAHLVKAPSANSMTQKVKVSHKQRAGKVFAEIKPTKKAVPPVDIPTYQCARCGQPLSQGKETCSGCGVKLNWAVIA